MDLRLITSPAQEPVALPEAQAHLRAPAGGAEAALIDLYLRAAREAVEQHTGRSLMAQTWELRLPCFPIQAGQDEPLRWPARRAVGPIVLPRPPVRAVTTLHYRRADGVEQLLASSAYQLVLPSAPDGVSASIWPAPGTEWPETREDDRAAVRITYEAGYASAADVPAPLRAAILLILGELYENREASAERAPVEIPAVQRLLAPFRAFIA